LIRSVDTLRALAAGGQDDSHRRKEPVTVFGAGKGGVGTSTLAGLAALHLSRQGANVLLVDADETVGAQHLLFGLPLECAGLGAMRGGAARPEDLLVEVAPRLTLLPGGAGGVEATLAMAAAERRILLRRVAGLYDRFDAVVVDGGSRLDSVMAACAAGAGRLVAVTTRDRIAQASAYALLKVARARFGGLPAQLVVNRAGAAEGREAHELVDAAARTFTGIGIPFGGAVPCDDALAGAVGAGEPLQGIAEGPAVEAVALVADQLLAGAWGGPEAPHPLFPSPIPR
jgi:MinD-like ATPase involved in chromosome partitioning or flagellar assembly